MQSAGRTELALDHHACARSLLSAVPEATVRRYREATKHQPRRPGSSRTGLHWSIEPDLYKRYSGVRAERPRRELGRLLSLGPGAHPRRGDPHLPNVHEPGPRTEGAPSFAQIQRELDGREDPP